MEVDELRLENEQWRDKVRDTEKWLMLLLNNFYEGNNQLGNIQQGLAQIDQLRQENFMLKREVLLEKRKHWQLQLQFTEYKRMVMDYEEEVKTHHADTHTLVQ